MVRAVGQQVDVSYVDYGNKETLSRDNIRPMYAKFMSLPAQAFVCSLDDVKPKGSSEWSKACITEFSNMVVEKQLIVLVKKKGMQVYKCVFINSYFYGQAKLNLEPKTEVVRKFGMSILSKF